MSDQIAIFIGFFVLIAIKMTKQTQLGKDLEIRYVKNPIWTAIMMLYITLWAGILIGKHI